MQATRIEWTDYSSNPLKYRDRATGQDVWACVKTSSGCAHCYAEAIALRFGRGGPFTKAEMAKVKPYLCEKELGRLLRSQKLAGKRVFLGDMTDLFGEWVPDDLLDRLFAMMALRSDVVFQVLTKRAERAKKYLDASYLPGGILVALDKMDTPEACAAMGNLWPLPNVWLGVSVEDQQQKSRIDLLCQTPAAVRFLSLEPLFEALVPLDLTGISWVIVGGESGHDAHPCHVEWVRELLRQCREADVPCFVKQLGSMCVYDGSGCWPIGLTYSPHPMGLQVNLRDPKGAAPEEWPVDLRVRQLPEVSA